ncbi:MAG: alpha-D-ribose 1-methylphosphonate 5-triphosphate diphosphatase [Pseudomonadota bacterium]
MSYRIEGAQVLHPDGLDAATIVVDGDRILSREGGGARRIDASGLILAPAFVDIHGDAFERQMMPRPGVHFDLGAAVLETDRLLAANGIATAYHALTLSWEPGLRSVDRGANFIEMLDRLAPRLTVDNRVQLRWETFAFEAAALIERSLCSTKTPALAFNDHTSITMRDTSIRMQDRAFEHSPDFRSRSLDDPTLKHSLRDRAARSGLGIEDFTDLLARMWARRGDVPNYIAAIAAKARAAGAPMLSHDDSQVETRNFYRSHGAHVAEFPMRECVAEAAREAGDALVFGAPNVVRGGSHLGSPNAADMIAQGLCDALASDYHYPTLLGAVARLHREGHAPLPTLWHVVSRGPAEAMGLRDRGEISEGMRADLILLDWPSREELPEIVMTMSGGRIAYLSRDLLGLH